VLDGLAPSFGTLLKRLRVEAGLSQEELAKRARISAQAIGAYERGLRRAPHRETFALLARALSLSGERYEELALAAERARLRGPQEHSPPTHNLPLQLTTLVGRDAVVADVRKLTAQARLVTLVGTGGIGKTRTALAVASQVFQDFRDGVWFADLSALDDPALVAGTIAIALGVAQRADRPVLDTLLEHLRAKELLLVLDNCEHVIAEAARVAEALLRRCAAVKVLTTSREMLKVAGERVHRVPPLDVPPPGSISANEAARYGAVVLFAECAAASESFELTDDNASIVAQICRRLDGIPFAIELAAARVKALPLARLVRELDERFRVLIDGSRTALPRQKTLRALLDWSYDLLTGREQRLFRLLSIFSGGWTLSAAAAVSGDPDVFDDVCSLVDKSLVVAHIDGQEERYDLLESTRAYALERLDRAGERAETARRHAEFVESFARGSLDVDQYGRRLALLRSDVENIRSALRWCLTHDETLPIAARILRDARVFLLQNLRAELLSQTREIVARGRLDGELAAATLIQLALVTVGSESLDAASGAVRILEEAKARTATLVRAYQRKSYALAQLRRVGEALESNRLATELLQELDTSDRHSLWVSLCVAGYLYNCQWQLEAAREAWTKALELSRAIDDAGCAAMAQSNLAETVFFQGDVEAALRLARECLDVFRREGLAYYEALTLNNMAAYRLHSGDRRAAADDIAAAVEAARRAGDDGLMVARAIRHTAMLSAMQDDFETAAELLGYSAAWFDARRFYDPGDDREFDELKGLLRSRVGPERFDRLMIGGAQLDEYNAWEKAQPIIRRAV
jgi:predicted ATPase/transcriptional regulator with XRE-family HTH domain